MTKKHLCPSCRHNQKDICAAPIPAWVFLRLLWPDQPSGGSNERREEDVHGEKITHCEAYEEIA